jgi:hypothetical protein
MFLDLKLELWLWTSQILRLQGPDVQPESLASCIQKSHQGKDRHS